MGRNTSGLRPRSAAWMRAIAASGGRASKGRPKTGRHRKCVWPLAGRCDRLSPYQVLRGEPAVEEIARLQGHGAWLLEAQEPVTMLRVARQRRGVRVYWQCPGCRRRVSVLYRPPFKIRWRCRQCWEVRYDRPRRIDRSVPAWLRGPRDPVEGSDDGGRKEG